MSVKSPIRGAIRSSIRSSIRDSIIKSQNNFSRQWTIGKLGDDYGFHVPNAYGGLTPSTWFDLTNNVSILIVDDSATAVILQADNFSKWADKNDVTLHVEGFGNIILTWNGANAYINVGATSFVGYIISQNGNTIGLNILPESVIDWIDNEDWTDSEVWSD